MSSNVSKDTWVLLPARDLAAAGETSGAAAQSFLKSMSDVVASRRPKTFPLAEAPRATINVLDSVREDGPKLIEISPSSRRTLQVQQPTLKVVPVVFYQPALAPRAMPVADPGAGRGKLKLRITSEANGSPIRGALVAAFTDFANEIGAHGWTDRRGRIELRVGAASGQLDRLYVYPEKGFWSLQRRNLPLAADLQLMVKPVDLTFTDGLRHFYGNSPNTAGKGVVVGVIDTGIAKHRDLRIAGGVNVVRGESPDDYGDNANGTGHGTHVAGIIAARGTPPKGIRGLAPAVTLRSYRVFGTGESEASSFHIAKAIERAVADDCDLINMSLGYRGAPDELIKYAIEDARSKGTLVIVAAGNDYRSSVRYPASESLSIAVSAMGRKGTFPRDSAESADIKAPYGSDRSNFIAAFSNVGAEIDLTGPGVGILSTVPGAYAPMSGTSMACPAVTGIAARVLSSDREILRMKRDQARSKAMAREVSSAGHKLGFGRKFEGYGLPR